MPRIALDLNAFHLGDEAIHEFRAALEHEGYEVEVRAFLGASLTWDLAVHLAEAVEDHALDAVIALALIHLKRWGRKQGGGIAPQREVTIYGPDDQPLRSVVIDDHELRGSKGHNELE